MKAGVQREIGDKEAASRARLRGYLLTHRASDRLVTRLIGMEKRLGKTAHRAVVSSLWEIRIRQGMLGTNQSLTQTRR